MLSGAPGIGLIFTTATVGDGVGDGIGEGVEVTTGASVDAAAVVGLGAAAAEQAPSVTTAARSATKPAAADLVLG